MNKSVLICDYCLPVRKRLKDILWNNGYYTILEASNGEEAIEYYKQSAPHLVILDLILPQVDGLMVLKEIKTMNPLANVIIYSAFYQQSIIVDAIELGAADFVVKPHIDMLELVLQPLKYETAAI